MGNVCKTGVDDEYKQEIQTGEGIYNFKKSKFVFDDQKEVKFHDKATDYDAVKGKINRDRSLSVKRSDKEYKNGMVDVVLF